MNRADLPGGGFIKPAEPDDNPGEVQAALMLMKDNAAKDPETMALAGFRPISCPVCQGVCYANAHLLNQASIIYPGRLVPVCTHCGIKAHKMRGALPLWLNERHTTPDQILREVLQQIARADREARGERLCPYCQCSHWEPSQGELQRHIWFNHADREGGNAT